MELLRLQALPAPELLDLGRRLAQAPHRAAQLFLQLPDLPEHGLLLSLLPHQQFLHPRGFEPEAVLLLHEVAAHGLHLLRVLPRPLQLLLQVTPPPGELLPLRLEPRFHLVQVAGILVDQT